MFTYDLKTNVGKVRLLIQDTNIEDSKCVIFNDDEVEFFLEQSDDNIYLASALALEVNASQAARLAKRKTVHKLSIDTTQISSQLLSLAKEYKNKAYVDTMPDGTSLLDVNQLASSLLDLEITGNVPRTDIEFAKQWLGDD